jgi:RNA polymerase sigma-70 factor (ECF subfamily)
VPPDRELVIAAQAGSRAAFEALVRRYQRRVHLFCLGYVHDHDVAADLSQRTLLRVLVNLQTLEQPGGFGRWLFRIAGNLALNQLREGARFRREPGPEAAVPAQAHAALESAERAATLRDAVARLPRRQRMVVELRVYEELSYSQIARRLDTTENGAKVNFHHANKRLRSLLGPGGEARDTARHPDD